MDKEEESEILNKLMPSAEELEIADGHVGILVLTQGEKMDGSPFYAYLSIPPSKYQEFVKAEKRGNYRLRDFGQILKVGDVQEPPDEVKKEMEEKYGANHNFEEDVVARVKEEQKKQNIFNKFGIKKK